MYSDAAVPEKREIHFVSGNSSAVTEYSQEHCQGHQEIPQENHIAMAGYQPRRRINMEAKRGLIVTTVASEADSSTFPKFSGIEIAADEPANTATKYVFKINDTWMH